MVIHLHYSNLNTVNKTGKSVSVEDTKHLHLFRRSRTVPTGTFKIEQVIQNEGCEANYVFIIINAFQ